MPNTDELILSEPEGINKKNEVNTILSERAAYSMVIGCLLIAAALVVLLFLQTQHLNSDPRIVSIPAEHIPKNTQTIGGSDTKLVHVWEDNDLNPLDSAKVALEYDAQFLRTKRAQSLVSARLFIQSIAILAGVTLLGMGSSFVFARIITPQPNTTNATGSDGSKFEFTTYSPGLVLALLGTVIICSALIASVKSKTETRDAPVFMDWPAGLALQAQKELMGKTEKDNTSSQIDIDELFKPVEVK